MGNAWRGDQQRNDVTVKATGIYDHILKPYIKSDLDKQVSESELDKDIIFWCSDGKNIVVCRDLTKKCDKIP